MVPKKYLTERSIDDAQIALFEAAVNALVRGNKENMAKLYRLFGQSGKKSDRTEYVRSFSYPEYKGKIGEMNPSLMSAAEDVMRSHMSAIRIKRAEAKCGRHKDNRLKRAIDGEVVIVGSRHLRLRNSVSRLTGEMRQWKPRAAANVTSSVVMHSRDCRFDKATATLHYTPHMVEKRYAAAQSNCIEQRVPLVATDRFIVNILDDNSNVHVPNGIAEGEVHVVEYLQTKGDKFEVKKGFLVRDGNSFGCAATVSDARKAAKMKSVRAAREALGIL